MADCFMQQDAAVAGRQDDFELSRRRLASVEHGDGLTGRFVRMPLGRLVAEVAERHPAPAAARSLLPLGVFLGDGSNTETKERLNIVAHPSVARRQHDLAHLFREARLGPDDGGIESMRGAARSFEKLSFGVTGCVKSRLR